MAIKQEMEFIIGPDGEIIWTTTGLKGADVKDALASLEKVVGTPRERTHSDHSHSAGKLAPLAGVGGKKK